jgi:hydrogen peroxide-dependent heme synthase
MSAITNSPAVSIDSLPPVPLTLEGSSVLHQMMRVRWADWRALPGDRRSEIVNEAIREFSNLEQAGSAMFSLIGHKGDLLLIHFRESFEDLNAAELKIAKLALSDYLEPTSSYLSVVELGLYDSTVKLYQSIAERGIQPHTPEWEAAVGETLERQRSAMKPRLYPEIPAAKYVCFYPMDRKRGEDKNWYMLPMSERKRQMDDHGAIGRRYAGMVKQIITGSIGFDDWEWGVDLFADDPLVFKKLIYEMRFDQVSAIYALFGAFYVGVRRQAAELGSLLAF